MSRKTVNGIKVTEIDEATRKRIERAGDIEDQVLKAAEIEVLDMEHYNKIIRGLKKCRILNLVMLQIILGYSLVNCAKFALYVLV